MSVSRGAMAGFAATVPMTITMEALRALFPRERQRRMPPREIVDRTVEKTDASARVDATDRVVITTAAHFGFGAAAGAVYGLLVRSGRSSPLTGITYGLAVWALAYGAALPALGLHRATDEETEDRNGVLIASHVVWGATLGALARYNQEAS
jgi:uncharacterized membrane protein YagU involved in acid resistance